MKTAGCIKCEHRQTYKDREECLLTEHVTWFGENLGMKIYNTIEYFSEGYRPDWCPLSKNIKGVRK